MVPAIRRLEVFFTRHIDGVLFFFLLTLMIVGLLTLFSASNASAARTSAQFANMLVALGVMWAFANIPPQLLARFAFPVYLVGVLLLVGVALFGDVVNGARRWLDLGVTRIQPSELMKIAVPLALAWYFDRYETSLRLRHYVIGAIMLVVTLVLTAGRNLLLGSSERRMTLVRAVGHLLTLLVLAYVVLAAVWWYNAPLVNAWFDFSRGLIGQVAAIDPRGQLDLVLRTLGVSRHLVVACLMLALALGWEILKWAARGTRARLGRGEG